MKKFVFVLIAMIFCVTSTAYADFYTWEDEDGSTHITDYPPPPSKKAKIYKEDSANPAMKDTNVKTKETTVILFTKNECPDCIKARDFLTSKNIKFTEYNMDTDKAAEAKRKEYDQNTDVPFAVINRSQIYGFSEAVFERTLKLNN